jgi:hypothetical protein
MQQLCGLEETYDLNQVAESTVSYLMARLRVEKSFTIKQKIPAVNECKLISKLEGHEK